ncbi:MAG TPA: ATP-binding cassette domain-containing protein [Actinoplanes sp.]|nr:ATP-binding cassette domain-containing protein [Actinoplanes sp.]
MTVLVATGAGVRHRRRWLVRGLDLTVGSGETVAVTGPPGSGRTSTLLALAGRLRLTEGGIRLAGTTSLGHVPGVEEPEPVFTVREHVRERLALLGRPHRELDIVPLHGLDPDLRGRDLSPYQRHLLGLSLARIGAPTVIALDGVDHSLDSTERDDLWRLLTEIAADGVTVLVTAREIDPLRPDHEIRLSDPRSEEPGRPTIRSTSRDEPDDAPVVPAIDEEPVEGPEARPEPGAAETVGDLPAPAVAETAEGER